MNKKLMATVTIAIAITVGTPQVAPVVGIVDSLTKIQSAGAMASMTEFVDTSVQTANVGKFSDVSESHWAYDAIMQAVDNGWFSGYPDGTFRPNAEVTRAEFATIVARASGLEANGDLANFDDITEEHWAYDGVNAAYQMGFISKSEYNNNKFNPTQAMTRFELSKWMSRGLSETDESYSQSLEDMEGTLLPFTEYYTTGFSDSEIPVVGLMVGTGIFTGYPDGSFGASKVVTRAEVVVVLSRYIDVENKTAEEYLGLSELREVGLTGTNALAMGVEQVFPDKQLWFDDIINEPMPAISSKGIDYGEVTLHRYIFVDTDVTPTKDKSIYYDMFVGTEGGTRLEGKYSVFSEVSLQNTRPVTSSGSFGELKSGMMGSRIFSDAPQKYGYTTLERDFVYSQYDSFADFMEDHYDTPLWTEVLRYKGTQYHIAPTQLTGLTFRW